MRQVAHPTLTSRLQFARALQARPFALLWAGQTRSLLGDAVFTIAITWEVLLLTGSATAMSLIVIAQWGPKIVLLLFGGVLADRVSRRLLMLWADAGRGCIVILVAWLSWSHALQFWHLVALAPLFGIVSSFFDPAYQAIMPQLVEADALPSANSLNIVSRNLGFLLGPMLSAGCITLFGPASAFAFDGLTFFISAIFLIAIRIPAPSLTVPSRPVVQAQLIEKESLPGDSSSKAGSALQDIRAGLRYVFAHTWLWVPVLASPLVSVGFAGPMWVSLPRLVRDVYGAGVWLIGAMATSDALGSIIAALLLGSASKLRRRGIVAFASIIVGGCALIVCAVPLPRFIEPVVAIVASSLVGCGLAIFMIIWGTLQQEKVPNDMLGRVSSITQLGSVSALPVGLVLAGLLADHIGPASVFAIGGILVVVPAALALCFRAIRRLE
ncbi:MAG TPA: MFS transporter [Ktedonobacteraceae bacterium]|nr:MFS transporter [Ktedonobacteraceae bacterium]